MRLSSVDSSHFRLAPIRFAKQSLGDVVYACCVVDIVVVVLFFCSEKDLDQVMQIQNVFVNVSKGQLANKQQLEKAFAGMKQEDIILEVHMSFVSSASFVAERASRSKSVDDVSQILRKGDLQVTQAERAKSVEASFRDIATIVADKCINSQTKVSCFFLLVCCCRASRARRAQMPFTVKVIEKAMHDAHFSLHPNRSAKQQALAVIALLKKSIPIERAQWRVQLVLPDKCAVKAREQLLALNAAIENEEHGKVYRVVRVNIFSLRSVGFRVLIVFSVASVADLSRRSGRISRHRSDQRRHCKRQRLGRGRRFRCRQLDDDDQWWRCGRCCARSRRRRR